MSGSDGDDSAGDGLEANHFGLDLPDELVEAATTDEVTDELIDEVTGDDLPDDLLRQAEADHYAELVAKEWGTPEGEWWP